MLRRPLDYPPFRRGVGLSCRRPEKKTPISGDIRKREKRQLLSQAPH